MARSRYFEVNCDTCQDEYVGPEPTMKEAVRSAKAQGWILAPADKGGDLCPACQRIVQTTVDAISSSSNTGPSIIRR